MLSGRLNYFTRTSVWRFTLAFTVIVIVINSGILAIVHHFSIAEQQRQQLQRINLAAQSFIGLSQAPKIEIHDFISAIEERSRNSGNLVLAMQVNGKIIGNLDHFPSRVPNYPRVSRFPVMAQNYLGQQSLKKASATRLNTAFGPLVVGLLNDSQDSLDESFLSASFIALGSALIITLVAGFIFNWRVLKRLKQISQLTKDVKAGRLQMRLPLSNRHDEYDHIALQINEMLDEIDELIYSVASVTDNIAHDLRTPLSRLRIKIESSLRHTDPDSDDEKWRLEILAELDQTITTFNAMLELSRLEKGVSGSEHKECNLGAICQDVFELLSPVAEDKEQTFTFQNIDGGTIQGDPSLLFRAIYNLTDNALKYTQADGEITLILQGQRITIGDNGPGIPEAESERVFQRLYRLDKSRHSEGFGLGLSIVKAIINLHKGQIQLQDNLPGLKAIVDFSN